MVKNFNGADTLPDILSSHSSQLADIACNVKSYGADPTGVNDSTAAFQNAINYVESLPNGGTILIPKGKYKFNGNLNIGSSHQGIRFKIGFIGDGIGATILMPTATSGNGFLNLLCYGTILKDFSIFYPNQVNGQQSFSGQGVTAPIAYPPTIYGGSDFSIFENIDLGNSYIGMELGVGYQYSSSTLYSRYTIFKNIIGFPLSKGLNLDYMRGSNKIENVTFSFESTWNTANPIAQGSDLHNWVRDNGTALTLLGGEGDVKSFNCNRYQTGIYFGVDSNRSNGAVDSFKITDSWMDVCRYPIQIGAFGGHLRFNNCELVGAHGEVPADNQNECVYLYGGDTTNGKIEFSECEFRNYGGYAVNTGISVTFNNCLFGKWNYMNQYFPAINANANNIVIKLINCKTGGTTQPTRALYCPSGTTGVTFVTSLCEFYNVDEGIRFDDSSGIWLDDGTSLPNHIPNYWIGQSVYSHIKGVSTSIPTSGSWQQGNIILNSSPTVQGSSGSQYVVYGWICTAAPGTWQPMRVSTGS